MVRGQIELDPWVLRVADGVLEVFGVESRNSEYRWLVRGWTARIEGPDRKGRHEMQIGPPGARSGVVTAFVTTDRMAEAEAFASLVARAGGGS